MSSATVEKPMASESAICQAGGGSVTMRAIIVIGADRKSTRLNSSHSQISYAVFCLKKKKKQHTSHRQFFPEHVPLYPFPTKLSLDATFPPHCQVPPYLTITLPDIFQCSQPHVTPQR